MPDSTGIAQAPETSGMTHPIDQMLAYHQAARHYPGALVLIEANGKTGCRRAAGRLHGHDGQDESPLDASARFRIASLSKPMVSSVVLMLIDQRKLALTTPVGELIPALRDLRLADGRSPGQAPCVRHLLTHTAGFVYAPEIRDAGQRQQALSDGLGDLPALSRESFVAALASLPLQAEPGTRFQYGYSTDVLGLIIEAVTGSSLETALRERLFEPLGMRATGFRVHPDSHAAMPTAFPEDVAWHRFCGQFESIERELAANDPQMGVGDRSGPMLSGGGGLVASLDDVACFARFLASAGKAGGRSLLSQAIFAQMVDDHLGPAIDGPAGFIGGGWGFGLGGAVRLAVGAASVPAGAGEFTWSGVTGQSLFVDPARGWFAIMLSANTASRVNVRFEFRRAASLC